MADGDTFQKHYGKIAEFIAAAVVIAATVNAAGSFFGVGPEWRLGIFAVLVVVVAFVFGAVGLVHPDSADLVYYVLAGVGIVFLFFDASAERLRISLAGEYAIATGNRDLFQQRRPELERVLGDIGPLLQKFRDAARAPETIARREKALNDCEALQVEEAKRNMQRQFEEMQRRIQSVPLSPGASSPYTIPRLDQGLVPPVDRRQVVASDPDLEALATVSNTNELVAILRRQPGTDLKGSSDWTWDRSRWRMLRPISTWRSTARMSRSRWRKSEAGSRRMSRRCASGSTPYCRASSADRACWPGCASSSGLTSSSARWA